MSKIQDIAYSLEEAIQNSTEFIQVVNAFEAIKYNEAALKMFNSFKEMQLNMQHRQMQGIPISEEEFFKVQQQVEIIQQNDLIANLMEAEQRLSMILNNVNQIMMRPLENLYAKFDM